MTEKSYYYFGCSDSFGENRVDDVFTDEVLPILKSHNIPDDDIIGIAKGIDEMVSRAYTNGMDSEAFNNSENN